MLVNRTYQQIQGNGSLGFWQGQKFLGSEEFYTVKDESNSIYLCSPQSLARPKLRDLTKLEPILVTVSSRSHSGGPSCVSDSHCQLAQ